MRTLAFVGMLFVALPGLAVAQLDHRVLCSNFEIFDNPTTRVYNGYFYNGAPNSRGQDVLPTALVTTELLPNGRTLAFYLWGRAPEWGITRPGCAGVIGFGFRSDSTLLNLILGTTRVQYVFDSRQTPTTASIRYILESGRTTHGWVELSEPVKYTLPFVLAASQSTMTFLHIFNHSNESGTIDIHAIDDTGEQYGPARIALGPNQAVQLNSHDLENGNARKGLTPGVGDGVGDWRLELTSGLNVKPYAYVRTSDGFVTSMSEVVPREQGAWIYNVPMFNPARNQNQRSLLRIVNPTEMDSQITIDGYDNTGEGDREVVLNLAPGHAVTITSRDLENGSDALDGHFGQGVGKWRLLVSATGRLQVVSMLITPTGHLTNLSR